MPGGKGPSAKASGRAGTGIDLPEMFVKALTDAILSDDYEESYRKSTSPEEIAVEPTSPLLDATDAIVRQTPATATELWLFFVGNLGPAPVAAGAAAGPGLAEGGLSWLRKQLPSFGDEMVTPEGVRVRVPSSRASPAAGGQSRSTGSPGGSGGGAGRLIRQPLDKQRLRPDEIPTGERLADKLRKDLVESLHEGEEFFDPISGQAYDALGTPRASAFWKAGDTVAESKFLTSIDKHLAKSGNITAIDLTGFTGAQKAAVKAHIDALPAAQQARIERIGF